MSASPADRPQPLKGIRVLDLSSVVVGPACSLRLADYGAEVIKVETIEGDIIRQLGGPSPDGQHSGKFIHFNRGKRLLSLNLKDPGARAALLRVLDRCDVFLSNLRLDALARLGLDLASLMSRNPALVCCTITGFGPGGPYRGRPAYDSIIQGASGVAGLMEFVAGQPRYLPLLIADHVTGEIAAGAILAALVERSQTGQGRSIEVPMHETIASFVLREHLGPATFQPALGKAGDMRVLDSGNRPMRTSDGWISVTSNTDAQARALLKAIGRAEYIDDPRFATVNDRVRNIGEWFGLCADAIREKPTAYWLERLIEADIPTMPCHTLDALPDDPHLQAVGLIEAEEHDEEGTILSVRPSVLFDGVVGERGRPAGAIGRDTRSVLREAGLSDREIDALVASGAAVDQPVRSETAGSPV